MTIGPATVRDTWRKLYKLLESRQDRHLRARMLMVRWRAVGLHAAPTAVVLKRVIIEHPRHAVLAAHSMIAAGSHIKCVPGRFYLGERAYLGEKCWVSCMNSVRIERDVLIGPGCHITDANHGFEGRSAINNQARKAAAVTIGEGAWLGAGVTVVAGVQVGQGAVVGAGAVVTRNVPDYAIVAGVPAHIIGRRGE